MKIVVKCIFGSHLYGTNTEFSDQDFKGVYLPTLSDCVLGSVKDIISDNTKKKSSHGVKNTKDDTDFELFSLQNFLLKLGKNGDTTFLDLIHAPDSAILETSPQWQFLRENRSKFYTKRLKSYMGYARRHSTSFINSSAKLTAVNEILELLNRYPDDTRLSALYDFLPDSTFSKKYIIENSEAQDRRTFDFCGRKFMTTSSIKFIKESLNNIAKEYGGRTKDALKNDGVNLKSLSHAFRVGYQLEELYSVGDITFPLKRAEWLRDMKLGNIDFDKDKVFEQLEELLTKVDILAENSNYPDEVDMSFWKDWLLDQYNI